MPTAEELLVAIRSEGVSETRQELDGVSQQMEETADQAGSSAEELEGFSNRFEGAITAAVSALAVGAAGLASQVPVLGELFSGVGAVVGALAFQMDKVLRPVLSPLTKAFFGVSDAIFSLDGAAGKAVGIITTIVTAVVGIGGAIAAVATQIFGFSAVWSAISGAVTTAVSAIVGAIGGIPLAIAGIIAAIVGFAAAYLTNWNGVRDTTNRIVGNIVSRIQTFVGNVADELGDLASDGIQFGKDLLNGFIDGVEEKVEAGKNAIRGFASEVRDLLPGSDAETGPLSDLTASGEALPRTFAQGISKNSDASRKATESALTGPQPGTFGGGGGAGELRLDGRKMTEDTGRYRSDASLRRGL